MLADLPKPADRHEGDPGFSLAAGVRMLRWMGNLDAIAVLAPAYESEILFRVLQGPHSWMLQEIAARDTAMARVNTAIQWIRRNLPAHQG